MKLPLRALRIVLWLGVIVVGALLLQGIDIKGIKKPSDLLIPVSNAKKINQFSATQIESEINNYRILNHKPELKNYPPLCDLAKIRVYEVKEDWSHYGFENKKNIMYEKYCNDDKTKCLSIAENLAKGQFYDSKSLIDGWAKSKGHNENILGDFNVQCVEASDGYFVSLFADAKSVDQLNYQAKVALNQKVPYLYEKVIFWEERKLADVKYLDSWKSGYKNEFYNRKKLDEFIVVINDKVTLADELWDGYTNSKINYAKAIELENRYYQLHKDTATVSQQLNLEAYKKCLEHVEKGEIKKEICAGYQN